MLVVVRYRFFFFFFSFKFICIIHSFTAGGKLDAAITDTILYMICKDGLPLSATENDGLKLLLKTTAPLYEVPGRKKVCLIWPISFAAIMQILMKSLTMIDVHMFEL